MALNKALQVQCRPGRGGWEAETTDLHFDGGLDFSDAQQPHINPIFQILFHVPGFVEFLKNDTEHRKACRSFLNCLTCGFFKMGNHLKKQSSGVPSLFLSKLTRSKCVDPDIYLNALLQMLCVEYAARCGGKLFPLNKVFEVPVSNLFQGFKKTKGQCSSCGTRLVTVPFFILKVTQSLNDSLHEKVFDQCSGDELMQCVSCSKEVVNYKSDSVTLPPYLLISLRRLPDKTHFDFTKVLRVQHKKYNFLACATGNMSLTVCSDGLTRMQQDSLVVAMSFDTFVRAIKTDRVLLVYCKAAEAQKKIFMKSDKEKLEAENEEQTTDGGDEGTNGGNEERPVDITEEATVDGPFNVMSTQTEPQGRTTDVGVQTEPEVHDAGVQVNFLDYERNKLSNQFKFWSGLSEEDFEVLFTLIGGNECVSKLKYKYRLGTPKKVRSGECLKYGYKDRLFIFLLRLRRGLPLEDLAWLAGMGVSQIGEICYVMTRVLQLTLQQLEPRCFPSAAEQRLNKPSCMKAFRNLRILLDGVEFRIETPSNFHMQSNTFSKYKATNTVRFIIGISCQGATIFVSPAAEGALSEKEAVLQGGLLERLDKGDVVMTDRGFEIASELHSIGAVLVKPPKNVNDNLTEEELIATKAIAPARIFTEHAMAEIKDNRLLQGTIPLSLYSMLPDLVYIAAYLRNFSPSRIRSSPIRESSEE